MRLPGLWRARMAVAVPTMALATVLVTSAAPAGAASAGNVGMGPDVDTVHRALVASPSHYVDLVDTEVSVVGIGVVTSGPYVFIVENFLRPSGRPSAPAPRAVPSAGQPSPWLSPALKVTRGWERTTG